MGRPAVKRYVTIVVTFSLALGIGFVMQNGDVLASRFGVDTLGSSPDTPEDVAYTPVRASGFIQPQPNIDETGKITTESSGVIVPAETLAPDMNNPAAQDGADAGCDIHFEVSPLPSAMVALRLDAPCAAETLATFQHQGMKFNALTDEQGHLSLDVPALAKEAYFVVSVGKAEGIAAITGVPDVAKYDRAVLQWRSADNLELHAFEFGAEDGQDGHVWQASMRSPADSMTGEGGYLTSLGAKDSFAPKMVQVYTYPSDMAAQDGSVALQVKAQITDANCGRRISAQSIQIQPDQPPSARNMTLQIPACDQVGEFLVLKNMFEDLTLAAR